MRPLAYDIHEQAQATSEVILAISSSRKVCRVAREIIFFVAAITTMKDLNRFVLQMY
jgi:hypothetical protein